MNLNFSTLRSSIESLQRALNVYANESNKDNADEDLVETLGAGVVQNFEFTYEQCWKAMKRWLEENIGSTFGMDRARFFIFAAENGLIDDVPKWREFHRARNETSHTYDVETAHDVVNGAFEFLPFAKTLLTKLDGSA